MCACRLTRRCDSTGPLAARGVPRAAVQAAPTAFSHFLASALSVVRVGGQRTGVVRASQVGGALGAAGDLGVAGALGEVWAGSVAARLVEGACGVATIQGLGLLGLGALGGRQW